MFLLRKRTENDRASLLKDADLALKELDWWQGHADNFKLCLARYGLRHILFLFSQRRGLTVKAKTFFGSDLYCILPEYYYFWFFGFFTSESELRLTKFLIKNLKEGKVFFDGGANVGFYTLLARKLVGPNGQVHSFEPTPNIFNLLKKSASRYKNIRINNFALGDAIGNIDFYVNPNASWENSIFTDNINSKDKLKISVAVDTIDRYSLGCKSIPDIIKLDVEGAEYNVVLGGKNILANNSPIIIVEILKDNKLIYNEISNYLSKFGYRPHQITENGDLVPLLEIRWQEGFENLVFQK